MEFSAATVYTYERLYGFNIFVAKKKLWFWILLAVSTLMCGMAFALSLSMGDVGLFEIFLVALIVLIDVVSIITYFVIPRSSIKKSPALNSTVNFEFYHDNLKISAETRFGKEVSELRYSAIVKYAERVNDIYLFISKNQAFIIDEASLSGATVEELKEFLKRRNVKITK